MAIPYGGRRPARRPRRGVARDRPGSTGEQGGAAFPVPEARADAIALLARRLVTALTDFAWVCDEADRLLRDLRQHPAFPPLGPLTQGRLGDARASSLATIDQRQALGREVAELLADAEAARRPRPDHRGRGGDPAPGRPTAVGPPPDVPAGDRLIEFPDVFALLEDITTWQVRHLRRLNEEAVDAARALATELHAVEDPLCRALATRLERFGSAAGPPRRTRDA